MTNNKANLLEQHAPEDYKVDYLFAPKGFFSLAESVYGNAMGGMFDYIEKMNDQQIEKIASHLKSILNDGGRQELVDDAYFCVEMGLYLEKGPNANHLYGHSHKKVYEVLKTIREAAQLETQDDPFIIHFISDQMHSRWIAKIREMENL